MTSYKEIYIDFERLGSIKPEEINFTKTGDFNTRKTLDRKTKTKGITLSLPNYLIFGLIEENTLSITITKIIHDKSKETYETYLTQSHNYLTKHFIKKYKIIFTDSIVYNICALPISEDKFILTVFTIDGQIKQLEFDNLYSVSKSSGSFNRNMNIIYSEYLNFHGSNFFALGSENGSIYLTKLENSGKHILSMEIVDEIKKGAANLGEKIGSIIPINLNGFFFSKTPPDSIKSIKHLGNNLIAFVTEQFNFKIYNYKKKKEIYSICLIKNRTDEKLFESKINFMNLALAENDVRESRSKCFILSIYMEYHLIHVIQSFEMWFFNIPELTYQMDKLDKSSSFLIKDFQTFYDYIDLGNDIRIKNPRVFRLNGPAIDIINYDKKIWIISDNPGYVEESIDNLIKYELNVFPMNCNEGKLCTETQLVFLDSKTKNLMNIVNHLKLNDHISVNSKIRNVSNFDSSDYLHFSKKNDTMFSILTNEVYIPSEILISFINKNFDKFSKNLRTPASVNNFSNKTQVISYLEKLYLSDPNIIETILQSVIKENLENEIFAFGCFNTSEIEGLAFVRQYGISFIKKTSEFQNVNNIINSHEYFIRNMIFSSGNIDKYQTNSYIVLYDLQSKILHYLTLQSREDTDNITYVLLALLRIYLTEVNIQLNDERYISKYFNNFEQFVNDHFTSNLTNQYSSVSFLDFFHEIIYKTFLNNSTYIEEHLVRILDDYESYRKERRESSSELVKILSKSNNNSTGEKFNSKIFEIISKIIIDKISSFFNIAKDLLSFITWKHIYINQEQDKLYSTGIKLKVEKMFIEWYSCNILANHRCKLSLKDGSVIEQVCLIERLEGINSNVNRDIEVNYVDLTIYENLYNFGTKVFHGIHEGYIDFIILIIWGDLNIENFGENLNQLESHTNYILDDPHRKRRYEQFDKLFKMKEYKLISLLIKLQNIDNLENIFLDIICQAYLSDNESIGKMKHLLNKFFSLIIDISNRSQGSGIKEFLIFENFYKIFCHDNKKIYSHVYNHHEEFEVPISTNFIITAYYYLEETLKKILSDKYKYDFYFHCYTFIYPTLTELSFILFSGAEKHITETVTQKRKIEEFLINMLRSCIDLEIELALSCYITMKDNFKYLDSIPQVVELFLDYLIKSQISLEKEKNDAILIKLLSLDNELIENICKELENKCKRLKDSNIFNLLKYNCKLETDSILLMQESIIGNNRVMDKEPNTNYFLILFKIYSILKDYQNAARISLKYSEAIQNVIDLNEFSLHDLNEIYQEKLIVLNNLIHSLTKCHLQAQSSDLCLIRNFNIQDHTARYVTKADIKREVKLVSIRISVLKYFINNETKYDMNEFRIEEINKIKSILSLLNFIFKYRLFSIILDFELIADDTLDEQTGKKLIINFIKANISCFSEVEAEEIISDQNPDHKLIENDPISYFPNISPYSSRQLIEFYYQIVQTGNITYLFTAIECLLFCNYNVELPGLLINQAIEKNSIYLMEIYIKYCRLNEFVDLAENMINEGEFTSKYLCHIVDKYSKIYKISNERIDKILTTILK